MDRYGLSYEGRAKFRRKKVRMNLEMAEMEGYGVLDYLYEHGAATVEEIGNYTGLSWEQVMNKLVAFIYWGYVEELAKQ